MTTLASVIGRGLLSARPAASIAGSLYYATDSPGTLYRDNGSSWDSIETAVGMTNPMTTTGDIIVGGASGAPARLAIGGANTLLHGGTTPAYSAVLPADLDVNADNTIADATIGHHGLLPKLGGGTTNFLRADGTWNAPAGGGASGGSGAGVLFTGMGNNAAAVAVHMRATSGTGAGSLVQTKGPTNISGGGSVTFDAAPTNGNLLLCFYYSNQYKMNAGGITSANTTWTRIAVAWLETGSFAVVEVWVGLPGASAGAAVSMSSEGNNVQGIYIQEWSGLAGVDFAIGSHSWEEALWTGQSVSLALAMGWPQRGGRAVAFCLARASSTLATPSGWTAHAGMPSTVLDSIMACHLDASS